MKIIAMSIYVLAFYFIFSLASAMKRFHQAQINNMYQDLVEIVGAVSVTTTSSLISCANECSYNDKCLTFFFNTISKGCVMHSKHFVFQAPSMPDKGWKYYVTEDVTGNCPSPYLYYRHLDFCYTFEVTMSIDFNDIKITCSHKGGKLAAIESKEKDEYFAYILANRPHLRVPIQGTRISLTEWLLDDESPMTYFNWYPTEPQDISQACLELKTDDMFFDCSCILPYPGVFICAR